MRGSPARSDLSMMFHGLSHRDDHQENILESSRTEKTPLPYKMSQYKSDDSSFSKLTPLLSGKFSILNFLLNIVKHQLKRIDTLLKHQHLLM